MVSSLTCPHDDFLNLTHKEAKAKMKQVGLCQTRKLHSKRNYQQNQKAAQWEKVFANPTSTKQVVSTIYDEYNSTFHFHFITLMLLLANIHLRLLRLPDERTVFSPWSVSGETLSWSLIYQHRRSAFLCLLSGSSVSPHHLFSIHFWIYI